MTATFLSCKKETVTAVKEEQSSSSQASGMHDLDLLKTWYKISSQASTLPDSGQRRLFKRIYQQWDGYLSNDCYPESVQVDGTIMWSGKTYEKDGLIYRVGVGDIKRVTGIGLTSGLMYKGEGGSRDTIVVYPDNSALGYSWYEATWTTSQGNAIIFDEHSTYYFYADGSGGRITSVTHNDTCR